MCMVIIVIEYTVNIMYSCCYALTRQKLTTGTLLLGAVREMHTFDMTVSLPYNMVGVVSCNDISDPFLELMKREVVESSEQEEEVN